MWGLGTPQLSLCLEQGSCWRCVQAVGGQVAGDKPLAPWPRAGKLVLGLSPRVETALRNRTAQGGLPHKALEAGACSAASLAGPQASSASANGVAVGLLLEGCFVFFSLACHQQLV